MTVECTHLFSPTRSELHQSSWLTVGKAYRVLSVSAFKGTDITFRVIADDGITPILVSPSEVKVISPRIPRGWIAVATLRGLEIGPSAFLYPGFWESFFNGEIPAVKQFWEVWEGLRELELERL